MNKPCDPTSTGVSPKLEQLEQLEHLGQQGQGPVGLIRRFLEGNVECLDVLMPDFWNQVSANPREDESVKHRPVVDYALWTFLWRRVKLEILPGEIPHIRERAP